MANESKLRDLDIQAITFDLDDTLWPCAPVIAHAESVYYDWIVERYPQVGRDFQSADITALRRDIIKAEPHLFNDVTESRRRATKELLKAYGGESDAEVALDVFWKARQKVLLYPDVLDGLATLKKHFRMGSITNGNACLVSTGIAEFFDVELAATIQLLAKPAPDMFESAFDALNVTPEQVLHVGDNPTTDIMAAQQLGCKTAWINRHDQVYPEDAKPANVDVLNLNELIDQLI